MRLANGTLPTGHGKLVGQDGTYGTAIEVAAKSRGPMKGVPSAAKAGPFLQTLTYELKVAPFKNRSFSAICITVPFAKRFSAPCLQSRNRIGSLFRLNSYSPPQRIVYFRHVALTPRSRSAIGDLVRHYQAVALSREAEGGKDPGGPLPHSRI